MEGFGVFVGLLIGFAIILYLKTRPKESVTSTSEPSVMSRDSAYIEGTLWQNFYDSAKSLLYAYGIFDENTISRFCRSENNFLTNDDVISFISIYESKDPPTDIVFKNAIRRNFELLTEELKKSHVPHSIEVRKHFENILDKCTTMHTYAYFRINLQLNFTGMVSHGIRSLNYFMYAYHFYLQAITQSPSFMAQMSNSVHNSLNEIGHVFGVLNDDQTWTDALEWGKLMCEILTLTITSEDLMDVKRIYMKLGDE